MMNQDGKRVTLQDIATATGYSVNAVSRALRDKGDISQQAKEQIRAAAQNMGYIANRNAVALRSGRSHIIAVILVDITNPFFSITTDLIQIAAQDAGYSLMILCSRNEPELEMQHVDEAISRCVDGVLLFPGSGSEAAIRRLQEARMPFVLLAQRLADGVGDAVVHDDVQGGYLAARHLIEAGHRRLAFIAAGDSAPSYQPRREGFLRACREAGIPECDALCRSTPCLNMTLMPQDIWQGKLLDMLCELHSQRFTGLFIFCDIEAWRIMEVLSKSDKFSPDDFGIVGFDNIDGALLSPTPLCSVDCSFADMARNCIALLLERIHGDTRPAKTVVCPAKIVCRASCGCAKKKWPR